MPALGRGERVIHPVVRQGEPMREVAEDQADPRGVGVGGFHQPQGGGPVRAFAGQPESERQGGHVATAPARVTGHADRAACREAVDDVVRLLQEWAGPARHGT